MELQTKISIYQWYKLFTEDDSICKIIITITTTIIITITTT